MKGNKQITLSLDVLMCIEKNFEGQSFSQWVEDQVIDQFMGVVRKQKEIDYHEKQAQIKKKELAQIKKLAAATKTRKRLTMKETQFWEQTDQILSKDMSFLDGRIRFYRNEFANKISQSEFLNKLEDYRRRKK